MVTWLSYGDESGIQEGARFCSVLGYVASPSQWKLFKRAWRRALGSVPNFHAHQFFQTRDWDSRDSFYHGWSDKKARRFLNGLLHAIDTHDIRPIGFGYDVEKFMALDIDARRRLTGAVRYTRSRAYGGEVETVDKLIGTGVPSEPYFLGFHYLVTEALKAAPSGATVDCVFDRRLTREAWAHESFDYIKKFSKDSIMHRLGKLSFAASPETPELQAADLYAYCSYRLLHNSTTVLIESALDRLGNKKPILSVGNEETFAALLADLERDRQEGINKAEEIAKRQRGG